MKNKETTFIVAHKEDINKNGTKVYTASCVSLEINDNFVITFMSDKPIGLKLGDKLGLEIKEIE